MSVEEEMGVLEELKLLREVVIQSRIVCRLRQEVMCQDDPGECERIWSNLEDNIDTLWSRVLELDDLKRQGVRPARWGWG